MTLVVSARFYSLLYGKCLSVGPVNRSDGLNDYKVKLNTAG